MSSDPLEALTNQLSKTQMQGEGVSFVGKSLKLNDANDAQVVTQAIRGCKNMEFLNLEGNTVGVAAAKAIGVAISTHPELKRALWKDMFTGRMKDEIPQALRYLGSGLDIAGARLVELDLSDNAFGPIGMDGLGVLLQSPSCYSLQELRLNNNGLGITGAKLLSRALMNCYESSKNAGNTLPLRVFIAGRNRLENEGITALSKVFKELGSLEEIQIPQNGIYHAGIRQLSEALKCNTGLRVLNLNDNTLGPKGSTALAAALPSLQMLRHINLGDCLLKTSGALSLAGGLQLKHPNLEELILDQNEIKKNGGLAIVQAMENKSKLKTLSLDGNNFGEDGIKMVKAEMKKTRHPEALGSLSDDEGDEDSEEEVDEDNEEEEEEEESDNDESSINNKSIASEKEESVLPTMASVEDAMMKLLKKVTVTDFLQFPTPERFLALEGNKCQQILDEIKKSEGEEYLERLLPTVMKVSGLTTERSVAQAAMDCANTLYRELFTWATAHDNLSLVNNSLLVHLGLIKNEDKKWRAEYNQVGCKIALKQAMAQNYFPQSSRETINCFLQKRITESIETVTLS
uniref:Ran-GTPase activating protein 1 C-terminal domain-containing protein n=1 Tax=Graphocephala atropunctata TaxID=36148 RepID=A0A1B6KVR9_9HEMI